MCPRVESNHDLKLRRLPFYPLNYGDIIDHPKIPKKTLKVNQLRRKLGGEGTHEQSFAEAGKMGVVGEI